VDCCQVDQQSLVRDVATCPQLSYGSLNATDGQAANQLKPLPTNIETRTESAPSVLPPSCQSALAAKSEHKLSASQSVPSVSRTSPSQNTECCRQDVVNVGATRSDVSDAACCQDVVTIASPSSDTVPPVILPVLGNVIEVDAQQPQIVVGLADDAVVASTVTAAVKCCHDVAAIENMNLTAADICEVAECSDVTTGVDVMSSIPAASEADSAAELTAYSMDDQDSNSLTSNTTTDSITEIGNQPVLAAFGLAAKDEAVDMADGLAVEPDAMALPMDEETNVSAASMGDHLDQQLLAAGNADVADDATVCCVDAVVDYASNGDSHSTLDDMPLVSSHHLSFVHFTS